MDTYILYLFLLIMLYLLAMLANKCNNKIFLYLIIAILTIVSGFRGETVGIDTRNYIRIFNLITDGYLEQAYGIEEGFKYFTFLILSIFKSNTVLLLVIAFLTNVCIILRMWDFRDIASLEWMVICYYISFYFMTMNIMRQFCAVAIVFYLTRLLNRNKYFIFSLFVIVTGLLFHKSALLGLSFLGLEILRWKVLEKNQKKFLKFVLLCFPLIVFGSLFIVQDKLGYFTDGRVEYKFGLMLFLKLTFVILTTIVLYKKESVNFNIIKCLDFLSVRVYYFIGIVLTSLGYILPFMDRVGLYFYIFEGVYIGMIMNNFNYKNKLVFGSIISLVFSYIFVMSLINDGQGVIPYVFM